MKPRVCKWCMAAIELTDRGWAAWTNSTIYPMTISCSMSFTYRHEPMENREGEHVTFRQ